MLIKLTNSCSGGCSHCLSNCVPCNEHMTEETLSDVLKFCNKYGLYNLLITGGEPTEHPHFYEFTKHIIKCFRDVPVLKTITIVTNGYWLTESAENAEKAKELINLSNEFTLVTFQVSTDKRFYPKKLDTTKRIFRERGIILCEDCVEQLYPKGRALTNNLDCSSRSSSQCVNIRLIARQLYLSGKLPSLNSIIRHLESRLRFCNPQISYKGDILLGESSLCPKCSSIYESEENIVKSILNWNCSECNLNKNLPKAALNILNQKIDL